MRLCAGIIGHSILWRQILLHEGFPCERVDPGAPAVDFGQFSVIIVAAPLEHSGQRIVQEHLRRGGVVLGYAGHFNHIAQGRREQIEFVVGEGSNEFPDTLLLDIGRSGTIPREANQLRTQSGTAALFAGELAGGYAVLLPCDPVEMLTDARSVSKSFYAYPDRLPSEQVSLAGKGELRHLIHRSLELVHHAQGLPYIHAWYFPRDERSLFAFRIDTDGGTREEVDTLYRIAKDNGNAFSWYLDVKSHLPWLHRFAEMAGQEIGVHCFEHQTYADFSSNLRNIQRAKTALLECGLPVEGFTAPYGHWNEYLAQAVDQLGFLYASDFSYMYDALPFHPERAGKGFTALQVPIHPVCIGSLRRAGFTEKRMMEYFAMVSQQKLMRHEPLFYYHHPGHRTWEVVEYLSGLMEHYRVPNITLGGYARWWLRRNASIPLLIWESGRIRVQDNLGGESDLWLHLTRRDGTETWTPVASCDVDGLTWHMRRHVVVPADLQRIREFDPRRMIGDLYTSLSRRFK